MHYYQFNIADYRKDTIHLSHLEHGIYRQLLDEYYLNEKPIKTQQVIRRLRILTQEEKTALENVLNDFFEHDAQEDSWSHNRAEESLEAYKAKAEISRANGSKGGRPKKPKKTQQVNSGLQKETQAKGNHKPLTMNQEPISNTTHASISSESDASAGDAQERLVGKTGEQLNRTEAPLFLELWNAYDFKKDRAKAIDAFKKIIVPMFSDDPDRNRKTIEQLLASIRTTVSSRDPNITPLYFERWITNRRWEDEDKSASSHPQDQSAVPVWKAKGFTSFEAFTEYNNQYATYTLLKAIKEKTPVQAQQFEHVRNYLSKNRPSAREHVTE